jgi:hypothetical protein
MGSVSGTVFFASGESQQEMFLVNRDRGVCGPEMRTVEWVRASEGRLLDVIVFIDNISEGKAFAPQVETVVLDQKDCRFAPLIQVVQDGGSLVLANRDPVLHNAQAYEIIHSARRQVMNVLQEAGADPVVATVRVTRGYSIRIGCNAHEFMHAWLFVARNPYYSLVDERGDFRIDDLPAGHYRLRAWHPRLGLREVAATVSAGRDSRVTFDY